MTARGRGAGRLGLAVLSILLCGCALLSPTDDDESQLAIVVANGGPEDAGIVLEQPNGEVETLPIQRCSSHTERLPNNRPWRVEVGGVPVFTLADATILVGETLTVYRLLIAPDGTIDLSAPEAADQMPDAIDNFPCARR